MAALPGLGPTDVRGNKIADLDVHEYGRSVLGRARPVKITMETLSRNRDITLPDQGLQNIRILGCTEVRGSESADAATHQ